jgi:hypothetical protein
MEDDVGSWKFRRYQQVLDIEVWVYENEAVAYTASYVRGSAEKRGRLEEGDVVNAFVTRYDSDDGVLRSVVKFARRLAQEQGYVVEEKGIGGVRVIHISGHGEKWALWSSKRHVVKIGGRDVDDVPGDLVKSYAKRYPSRIAGGILEGPLPPGKDKPIETDEPYDSDSPRPDWDNYDPDEVEAPKSDDPEDEDDE